jgi:hypothetical protein
MAEIFSERASNMTTTEQSSPSVWTSWRMLVLHLVIWAGTILFYLIIKDANWFDKDKDYLLGFQWTHLCLMAFLCGLISRQDNASKHSTVLIYMVVTGLLYAIEICVISPTLRLEYISIVIFAFTSVMILVFFFTSIIFRKDTVVGVYDEVNVQAIVNQSPIRFSMRGLMVFVTCLSILMGISLLFVEWSRISSNQIAKISSLFGFLLIYSGLFYGLLTYYIRWRILSLAGLIGLFLNYTGINGDMSWVKSGLFYSFISIAIAICICYRWVGLRIVPIEAQQPTTKPMRVKEQPVVSPFED